MEIKERLRQSLLTRFLAIWTIAIVGCSESPVSTEQAIHATRAGLLAAEINPIDFGELSFGPGYHAVSFPIKNEGDSELRIVDVRTSCGCVSAKIAPTVLLPGLQATVNLRLASDRLGSQSTQLTICTDSTIVPEYAISIMWKNLGKITPLPASSIGNVVKVGETMEIPIELKIRDGEDAGCIAVSVEHEEKTDLTVAIEQLSSTRYLMKAFVRPEANEGLQTGRVIFSSNILGEVFVPFSFQVEPDITIHPKSLWLTKTEGTRTGELVIRCSSGPFENELRLFSDEPIPRPLAYETLVSKENLKIIRLSFCESDVVPKKISVQANGTTSFVKLLE